MMGNNGRWRDTIVIAACRRWMHRDRRCSSRTREVMGQGMGGGS